MRILFVLIALSATIGGCSMHKDTNPPPGVEITRLGALLFEVQTVTAKDLYQPIVLPNQTLFKIDTLEYRVTDQTALIIGFPVNGNASPTQRCSLTQPLTANAISQGRQSFASLQLCHETVPPGTVIFLDYSYRNSAPSAQKTMGLAIIAPVTSFSVDGYGTAAAFPLYEEDNITGICNDSPVADVVQTMLGQIDFSQSMSCVSL